MDFLKLPIALSCFRFPGSLPHLVSGSLTC